MSILTTALTNIPIEELTALVRREDGRLQDAPRASGTAIPFMAEPAGIPAYPSGLPSRPSWMQQETLISGWKNQTLILGAVVAGVVAFMVFKPKPQVIL